jgi:hypothetical protein
VPDRDGAGHAKLEFEFEFDLQLFTFYLARSLFCAGSTSRPIAAVSIPRFYCT